MNTATGMISAVHVDQTPAGRLDDAISSIGGVESGLRQLLDDIRGAKQPEGAACLKACSGQSLVEVLMSGPDRINAGLSNCHNLIQELRSALL